MSTSKINIEGFLDDFYDRHTTMQNRPFCWVLGSGASVQSGIKSGGTMASEWLVQLHKRKGPKNQPIEQWATAENLGISGFDYKNAASFYPYLYQRRFQHDKEAGYAYLENAMDNVEPSYGYSVLAQLMAHTGHRVAVTTNFDNLVADALSIYTRVFPLVCGHESLTGYIRANPRRPIVAKIHRDLLLDPKSEPGEIAKLPPEWEAALRLIFTNYTPVVIGYGGNDGSLMGFLETLEPIRGGIYWCQRGEEEPEEKVRAVIARHNGSLVPIAGFDEVMLQLWQRLGLATPLPDLQKTHEARVAAYRKQFEELTAKLAQPAESPAEELTREPARAAAQAAVERVTKEKNWWAWELKTQAESNPAKCEAIYREALQDFPDSAELTGNFANFMKNVRKDDDEAERLYRHALELDPKSANNTGNFAVFIQNVRKDDDEAERLYRHALELDPKSANNTGNYAVFMTDVRKDHDEAERLYRHALELDPKSAGHTGNFALFITDVRKDHDEAERLYRHALELDPMHAGHTSNFAAFIADVRKDYVEAERLFRRALELAPEDARIVKEYADFRAKYRKGTDERK